LIEQSKTERDSFCDVPKWIATDDKPLSKVNFSLLLSVPGTAFRFAKPTGITRPVLYCAPKISTERKNVSFKVDLPISFCSFTRNCLHEDEPDNISRAVHDSVNDGEFNAR
jgi:hypothetical protein